MSHADAVSTQVKAESLLPFLLLWLPKLMQSPFSGSSNFLPSSGANFEKLLGCSYQLLQSASFKWCSVKAKESCELCSVKHKMK